MISLKIFGCAAVLTATAFHSLAIAQSTLPINADASELQSLSSESEKSKYLHVLIGLNVKNSIQDLKENPSQNFSAVIDEVLKSIDGNYAKGSVWKGQLGQISAYVTTHGLQILTKNPNVRNITRATDRGDIYDPYEDLKKIRSEIESRGTAKINLIPASSKLPIAKNGAVEPDLMIAAKEAFIKSWAPGSIKNYDLSGVMAKQSIANSISAVDAEASSLDIEIGIEGFYELTTRGDILSARLIDRTTQKLTLTETPAIVDEGALEEARKMGTAMVIIHLKRLPGYTPISKLLTPEQSAKQQAAIKRTFEEIISKVDPSAVQSIQHYGNIASAAVQLNLAALKELYKNPDSRIERIDLNRPLASTALQYSTAAGQGGTNAQYIWNYARGAGQFVAIIDSGVHTTHPMFFNKNIGHACFGTTSSTHYSTCPAQNAANDSPYLYPNSGFPCGYITTVPDFGPAHYCKHGTHVAGIAAGRGGTGNKNGVAIDADLFVINTMSRSRTDERDASAYSHDLVESVKFVRQLRRDFAGITINMSLGGIQPSSSAYTGNCDSVNPALSDLIAEMHSLDVAVVAATGNNYIRAGIAFPACISRVVKVGATNVGTGTIIDMTNMYYPPFYTGQFFLAPGNTIESSTPNNTYSLLAGTSMAAPHISGAFAVIKSAAPNATVDDVNAYIVAAHSVPQNIGLSGGYNAVLRRLRFQ